jgi:hypothetical protein
LIADALEAAGVADDLHKCLWINPLVNKGVYDPGWSCREHALVLGLLSKSLGDRVRVGIGQAFFVQTERARAGVGCVPERQERHAWLEIEDEGILDLSPNLDVSQGAWSRLPFGGIVGSAWRSPGVGQVVICASRAEYAQRLAIATHAAGESVALYWTHETVEVDAELVRHAFTFTDGPLTGELSRSYGPDILSKLTLHLRERASGTARSLMPYTRAKAWKRLDSRQGDAIAEMVALIS